MQDKEKPTESKPSGIEQFVEHALQRPADCQIKISQIPQLYESLTQRLKRKGLSTAEIVDLVNVKLLGVCPKCHTPSGGQGLAMIGMISIFTGATGGAERLKQGQCRNYSCSSLDILIFWRPDEDESAADRLSAMGIEIKRPGKSKPT